MNQNVPQYLYKGGLAEVVVNPSDLTYSFIRHWFSGVGALADAWKLLHIPYRSLPQSVLIRKQGELYLDLQAEEALLYADTGLTYIASASPNDQPSLTISWRKLFLPINLMKTIQLILRQSLWIANPEKQIQISKIFLDLIPEFHHQTELTEIDATITHGVLPYTLAIDYLHEYFQALLFHKNKHKTEEIRSYIYQEIRQRDWIFQSIQDQYRVKTQQCSFDEYMNLYGMRADDEYELTCPRWIEQPDELKKRIDSAQPYPQRDPLPTPNDSSHLIHTCIELSVMRTEARRKTMAWIYALRQSLLEKVSDKSQFPSLDRTRIGLDEPVLPPSKEFEELPMVNPSVHLNKPGIGVSPGTVKGRIKNIVTTSDSIEPQTIAIFPNANPMFASLYSHCAGIIFLSGGKTSHGVIVSREYGIPAIIAPGTIISDGTHVELNGSTGTYATIA